MHYLTVGRGQSGSGRADFGLTAVFPIGQVGFEAVQGIQKSPGVASNAKITVSICGG